MFDNGYYFTGYAKDNTGAPGRAWMRGAFDGRQRMRAEDGLAEYSLPKCLAQAVPLFADQDARSVVSVMRRTAEHPSMDERFLITGLKDATLTVRPPVGARVRMVDAEKDGRMCARSNVEMEWAPDGKTVAARHLTGSYYISWQSDHNPGCMLRADQLHPQKSQRCFFVNRGGLPFMRQLPDHWD